MQLCGKMCEITITSALRMITAFKDLLAGQHSDNYINYTYIYIYMYVCMYVCMYVWAI